MISINKISAMDEISDDGEPIEIFDEDAPNFFETLEEHDAHISRVMRATDEITPGLPPRFEGATTRRSQEVFCTDALPLDFGGYLVEDTNVHVNCTWLLTQDDSYCDSEVTDSDDGLIKKAKYFCPKSCVSSCVD